MQPAQCDQARQRRPSFTVAPGAALPASAAGAASRCALQPSHLDFAWSSRAHCGGRARLGFASLSAARGSSWCSGSAAPHELFLLSRHTDSASSSSAGGSSQTGGSSGYGSSSDSDGSDSGDSSDLHLDKLNCRLCQRLLSERPGRRRSWLPWRRGGRRGGGKGGIHVCDCCQACFHGACCKQRGISTKEGPDGEWYHSRSCEDCERALQQQVKAGQVALPSGRSWQLLDLAPVSRSSAGGVKALNALKQQLSDVLEVLLTQWGPGAAQQIVDTTKGHAVLLRQGKVPVCAALLDVYGQEAAVLDLVATALGEQGKGHCPAMLGALEAWLGPGLGVGSLIAVCPADEPRTVALWTDKYRFKRIPAKDLRRLQASVPPLSYYADSILLKRGLAKQKKQPQPPPERKHEQQQQPAAAAQEPEPEPAPALPVAGLAPGTGAGTQQG